MHLWQRIAVCTVSQLQDPRRRVQSFTGEPTKIPPAHAKAVLSACCHDAMIINSNINIALAQGPCAWLSLVGLGAQIIAGRAMVAMDKRNSICFDFDQKARRTGSLTKADRCCDHEQKLVFSEELLFCSTRYSMALTEFGLQTLQL